MLQTIGAIVLMYAVVMAAGIWATRSLLCAMELLPEAFDIWKEASGIHPPSIEWYLRMLRTRSAGQGSGSAGAVAKQKTNAIGGLCPFREILSTHISSVGTCSFPLFCIFPERELYCTCSSIVGC